jgi:hypothetical protein
VIRQLSSTICFGNHSETIGTNHPSQAQTADRRTRSGAISIAFSRARESQSEPTITGVISEILVAGFMGRSIFKGMGSPMALYKK